VSQVVVRPVHLQIRQVLVGRVVNQVVLQVLVNQVMNQIVVRPVHFLVHRVVSQVVVRPVHLQIRQVLVGRVVNQVVLQVLVNQVVVLAVFFVLADLNIGMAQIGRWLMVKSIMGLLLSKNRLSILMVFLGWLFAHLNF